MADIPRHAIAAAAEAIERKLLTDPPGECMTWLEADEELARAALTAAEQVWPHDPPRRDPASTTAASTTLASAPALARQRPDRLPPRRETGGRPAFGFTRDVTA
jgi:hypothetical protein